MNVELDLWAGRQRFEVRRPCLVLVNSATRLAELRSLALQDGLDVLLLRELPRFLAREVLGEEILINDGPRSRRELAQVWNELRPGEAWSGLRALAEKFEDRQAGRFEDWLHKSLDELVRYKLAPKDLRAELERLQFLREELARERLQGDGLCFGRLVLRSKVESKGEIGPRFKTIIFDQLEVLDPFEEELCVWLAGCAERLVMVSDPLVYEKGGLGSEALAGSRRLAAHLPKFEKRPLRPLRQEPFSALLFDGSARGTEVIEAEWLELCSGHDRREELRRAARVLSKALAEGFEPWELGIAVPDVEAYEGLVEELVAETGLPLMCFSTARLAQTEPVMQLRALLRWLAEGHGEAMHAALQVLQRQGWAAPALSFSDLQAEAQGSQALAVLLEALLKIEDAADELRKEAVFDFERLHAASRRAQVRGGLDFAREWWEPMLLALRSWLSRAFEDARSIARVLFDLLALKRLWLELRALIDGDFDRQEFWTRLKLFLGWRPDSSAEAMTAVIALVDDLVYDDPALDEGGFSEFVLELEELLGQGALESFRWSGKHCPVLSWADACVSPVRRRRRLLILGLSAGVFPGTRGPALSLAEQRVGEYAPQAWLRWLLLRSLRSEENLSLCWPRIIGNERVLAAGFFNELESLAQRGFLKLGVGSEDLAASSWRESALRGDEGVAGDAVLERRIGAALRATKDRDGAAWTAFDGVLGEAWRASLDSEKARVYSPTALEMLADCAHRYFFKSVLYLGEFSEVEDELPRHEVGTAVHECLEIFFIPDGRSPWTGEAITASNFARACEVMKAIAEDVLERSGIDWTQSALRRSDRRSIVRGLDEPGDDGPRGMLKAALAFQRDIPVLAGPVFRTELGFGVKGSDYAAYEVAPGVQVRGFIDRLDMRRDEQGGVHLTILDYKTGRAKTVRDVEDGQALQIAIYAMVARSLPIAKDLAGLRGGLLTLERPNRRLGQGKALDHPIEGVYREHLAVGKLGRSWVTVDGSDPIVGSRLEAAKRQIQALDARAVKGDFAQSEAPKSCSFCDYRAICFHDEALIRFKKSGAESPPVLAREPSKVVISSEADVSSPAELMTAVISRSLSAEQEAAADAELSCSVSAGAGSGKTYLLKTRVTRLIRLGAPIQSLLAITFTEKAAAEIRERIEASLSEALEAGEFDGQALSLVERERFVRARAELPDAVIGTIHSFCQRLLAADPILAARPAEAEVVTGPELDELKREALRAVFRPEARCSEDLERLFDDGVSLGMMRRKLYGALSSACELEGIEKSLGRSRADWSELWPRLKNDYDRGHIEPVLDEIRALRDAIESWMASSEGQAVLSKKPNRSPAFAMVLGGLDEVIEKSDAESWSEAVEILGRISEGMNEQNAAMGLRASKSMPRNLWKELRDFLMGLKLSGGGESFEVFWRSIELGRCFVRVAQEAQATFEDLKRARRLVDFDDLILRAEAMLVREELSGSLLERRERLLKALRRRFQHILVDEFQDTDRRQWAIIQALLRRDKDDPKVTAFIVGDPKQSIYSWRGSDNRVFEWARKFVREELGGKDLVLADNYRSSRAVLSWVNSFFNDVFESEFRRQPDGSLEALVETAVRPQEMRMAGDWGEGSVTVFELASGEDSEEGDEDLGDESSQVAALVRSILDGDPKYRTRPSDGPRVGVLCRTARQLRRMAQALDVQGVVYTASHRAGFFSQPAVQILETALRAIVFREDEVSLVGLLRGPIFSWSDEEIFETRRVLRAQDKQGRWTAALRRGEGGERARDFGVLLEGWRALAGRPSALLRKIVAESGLDVSFARLGRMGSVRDLWRFIELVEGFEKSPNTGLVDLLAWLKGQRATANEGAALEPAEDIPVVLTTIHASKGLEFPVVILPELSWRGQSESDFIEAELPGEDFVSLGLKVRSEDISDDYERIDTLLTRLLGERAKARVSSEEKRLFYVACTRAREHLILPVKAPGKSSKLLESVKTRGRARVLREAGSYRDLLYVGLGRGGGESAGDEGFEML